ncbi:cryptochrome/photolyase family protein [Rhizobium sp. SG2393]|uniref:cryptochrome/photolyase family protein n=1 Tax=Rhizobium sp. SG2393 TaxID=3276279 RepID=UPI003672F7D5
MSGCRHLVFILGDQLSEGLSSLEGFDAARDRVLMVEVMEEATYVRHHPKKIAFIFSAMRHFAEGLRQKGFEVDYVALDDRGNSGSFTGELERAVKRLKPEGIRITEPGEWRVLQMVEGWEEALKLPVAVLPDSRFLCSRAEFAAWAKGRKQLRMEYFYREMRRKTGLLMRGEEPEGGKWNYDAENREPPSGGLFSPKPPKTRADAITKEVLDLVGKRFADHFGSLDGFHFAVTAEEAEAHAADFIAHRLKDFGRTQDAMVAGDPYGHHSLLSFYINVGLIGPIDLCRRVERAYHEGAVPLNSAEGFIRQIIGWREYVRGVYWLFMPDYLEMNELKATRDLPAFYWSGETQMACLKHVITDTRENAYAHHIQRLMITGNFALLIGADPKQVHRWYLEVYADAFEWVELPNTLGMSQFADGGKLGSKPYAAGGAYIDRMSDYCGGCRYDVKKKTGEGACPFNALYWDFLDRNAAKLKGNQRLATVYASWGRMKEAQKAAYRESAAAFLEGLDGMAGYGQG